MSTGRQETANELDCRTGPGIGIQLVADQHHQYGDSAQPIYKIVIPVDAGVDVPDVQPVFLWEFGFSDFHEPVGLCQQTTEPGSGRPVVSPPDLGAA